MRNGEVKITLNQDTSFIKLIAAATMLCDHIGKIFFPEIIGLQVIGRIAFPIFAYCVVVGALYTRDIKKYMLRLGLLAFFTQYIYIQTFAPGATDISIYLRYKNILFTLLTGLIAVYGIREKKWFIFCVSMVFAFYAKLDYGFYGVLLIISFYLFRENNLISFLFILLQLGLHFLDKTNTVDILNINFGLRGFAVLSLPFIYIRTNIEPKISKNFFYFFYPAHLFALLIVQVFLYSGQ